MRVRAGVAAGVLGAVVARLGYAVLKYRPPGQPDVWTRTNHRDDPVTLLAGPACAAGASVGLAFAPGLSSRVRWAGSLAAAGAGACGAYDDLAGSSTSRGFAGHVGALRHGTVTSGLVKIAGIGATGVCAAALLPHHSAGPGRAADVVLAGTAVAGSANLVNLFDLRPGRAIKVSLLAGAPLLASSQGRVAAAPLGAAAALLPEDLGERAMLGDAGANAMGAAVGLAAASALDRQGRLALLAVLAGLTAASEAVSFSKVIDAARPFRWLDHLGRGSRTPLSGSRGRHRLGG